MSAGPRARRSAEVVVAVLSTVLFVTTVVVPDWIEVVFGIDPDRSSGTVEILISAASLTATIGFAGLARQEHRRERHRTTSSGSPGVTPTGRGSQ